MSHNVLSLFALNSAQILSGIQTKNSFTNRGIHYFDMQCLNYFSQSVIHSTDKQNMIIFGMFYLC